MAKKQQIIQTLDEVDSKLLELGGIQVHITKAEAGMNSEIQKARKKFDDETKEDRAQANLLEKEIQQYLEIHKSEYEKIRTSELTHGKIGFRSGTPKVVTLNKKFTFDMCLEKVKQIFGKKYVRVEEEINKEAILADYAADVVTDEKLAGIGLRVDKGEKYIIEPKWEELKEAA